MEPFPDVLVVSDNYGMVRAVCSGCVKEGEKVEGNLTARVHNDLITTTQGYATALHEYKCPRCDRTDERTG